MRRTHRFQSAETDGLLELSKELTRLFIERVNIDNLVNAIKLQKADRKPGSLKVLEKLIEDYRPKETAKAMMTALFGIYNLWLADAHPGSGLVASRMARANIDDAEPKTIQRRQLLRAFVDTLDEITSAIQ